MPRKIVLEGSDGAGEQLEEVSAANEAQLQNFLKANPELLPIEELELGGPMMVVGAETQVNSGAIDLVGITPSADILLIEFKTGPQNPDFRQVLAQLLDYGSDVWAMSFQDFEDRAVRYFRGERCRDPRTKGQTSLLDAAISTWESWTEEESTQFQERIFRNLSQGSFHYVVAAQRITKGIQQTIEYLNAAMVSARFYGVEVVKFQGPHQVAYEARTVVKPTLKRPLSGRSSLTDEASFLDQLGDDIYRRADEELFDLFRELDLRFEWGSVGTSVRVIVQGIPLPITVGWFFPPGRLGWMGLTDVTLGYSATSTAITDPLRDILDRFVSSVGEIPGAVDETRGQTKGFHLSPAVVVEYKDRLERMLRELVNSIQQL